MRVMGIFALAADVMTLPLSLGFLSGANLFILFLFQAYILLLLGPGTETDALFAGMALPQLALAIISGSLMHVLVPFLAGEEEGGIREDVWGILLIVTLAFGAISAILYSFAAYWVPLIVPGFSRTGITLTIRLTRIQLIGVSFTAVTGVLWALYHARKQFLWAEFSPLAGNLIGLGCLYFALPRFGIVAAAWILVLRTFLHMVLLLPGLPAYRTPNLSNPTLRQVWSQIKPLLLGSAYYKTDLLIDRFLSSMAPPGGLSLLYLAQQLYSAANEIVNKAIAAPMVPVLASHAKNQDWPAFHATYRRRILWMGFLTAGGYLLLLITGELFLRLLIGRGIVTEHNVSRLYFILVCLGGVFIGGALGQILSTAFYAKMDTVTPTKIGAVVFTVGIVLKVAGSIAFGVPGIAAGTSAYFLLAAAALYLSLERTLRTLRGGP